MITRDNYEEFFLLYVDNELSAADRHSVDEFVAENPDLKEELATLIGCRLQPENEVFFEDRDLLLQPPAHYSEWFLSYVDGELNEEGRRAVEEFVLAHPSLLKELTLLRATVSFPEKEFVFENKASLYREEKRRILFLPFFRIAAAALVLGAIGLLTLLLVRKNAHEPVAGRPGMNKEKGLAASPNGDAHRHDSKDPDIKKIPPAVTPRTADPLYPYTAGREEKKEAPQGTERIARSTEQEAKRKEQRRHAPVQEQEDQERLVAKAGTDGTGDKVAGVPLHTRTTERLIPDRDRQVRVSGSTSPLLADAGNKVLIKATVPLVAAIDPIESEEDEPAMGASSKKNKLRGFFRKVSRTFEKTASRNEDEGQHGLLVGNLQIALK